MEGIAIKAEISRVATAADGGFKIALNVPENEKENVAKLFGLTRQVLNVAIVPEP